MTRSSLRSRHAFVLAACCGIPSTASAQMLEKSEFLSGPPRAITGGPRNLKSEMPCFVVLDLQVSRAGQVTNVAVNDLSDCPDSAFRSQVATLARTYVFAANTDAPEPQAVRLLLSVGDARIRPVVIEEPELPPASDEDEPTFASVEEPPRFPGGDTAMNRYVAETLRYPSSALEAKQEGVVYMQFVVTPQGRVEDVAVLKGVAPDLDAEAVRVVKGMPKWIPGKQAGRAVHVRWVLPIRFHIQ